MLATGRLLAALGARGPLCGLDRFHGGHSRGCFDAGGDGCGLIALCATPTAAAPRTAARGAVILGGGGAAGGGGGSGGVGGPWRVGARDRAADQRLDGTQILVIRRHTERDCHARPTRAARAADAVDVIFGMAGQIVVEHMADAGNIKPACRHIRCDQETQLAFAEPIERAGAMRLVQIAMDRLGIIAVFLERFRNDIHIHLAVAEDDRIGATFGFGIDGRAQHFTLFAGRGFAVAARGTKFDQPLFDGFGCGGLSRHFDAGGVRQKGVGDPFDLGRHGGRKEQRLPGKGHKAKDALDIGDEAHVEHAVRLVHDHDLDVVQDQLAALEMIQKPPRRGDQHIDALVDEHVLLLEADAADQQRLGQLYMLGVGVEILGHLGGQFAGGAQDQGSWHARAGTAAGQDRDHRQREAGRLAGAGLGNAQHVAPFKRGGDGAGLNRGGGFVACFGYGFQNLGIKVEVGKACHMRPVWPGQSRHG